MTRVNVVPPSELCDQHLLAEHREITRIPNMLLAGKLKYEYNDRPDEYTLGAGHIKFFTNKMRWLWQRYLAVHAECIRRGFAVTDIWPYDEWGCAVLDNWNDWKVTPMALRLNRARIRDRMPANARWTEAQSI
jgi:deoxyribonuclease (pyrimidine dimer)